MKTLSRQPQSRSREGRIERGNILRKTRRDLNLAKHPDFGRKYNEWTPGGRPAGYFVYTYLGYEVRLRYSQATDEWTALCLFLNIQKTFPDQTTHQDIQELLNNWLTDHIEQPASFEACLRLNRPSVKAIAARHGLSSALALEIYDERGF